MPRFPKKEAEIAALADALWNGLLGSPVFPSPPVHPAVLRVKSLMYNARRDSFLAKQAEAEAAITTRTTQ